MTRFDPPLLPASRKTCIVHRARCRLRELVKQIRKNRRVALLPAGSFLTPAMAKTGR